MFTKSMSWPGSKTSSKVSDKKRVRKHQVATTGCFSVYVGPEEQRFVIKTELVNHPLFKMLLDDAECEYGFNCEGPLRIPCDVGLFYKVLAEMHSGDDDDQVIGYGSCSPFSPARRLGKCDTVKGFGSYSRMINHSQG